MLRFRYCLKNSMDLKPIHTYKDKLQFQSHCTIACLNSYNSVDFSPHPKTSLKYDCIIRDILQLYSSAALKKVKISTYILKLISDSKTCVSRNAVYYILWQPLRLKHTDFFNHSPPGVPKKFETPGFII